MDEIYRYDNGNQGGIWREVIKIYIFFGRPAFSTSYVRHRRLRRPYVSIVLPDIFQYRM